MKLSKVAHGVRSWVGDKSLAVSVGVACALPSLVFAQASTDPFDLAIADATDKVEGYAGALVAFGAVAVLFMIALKYVKKIPRAA